MKKISALLLLSLVTGCLFLNANTTQAADTETGIIQYPVISVPPTGLPVYDFGVNTQKTMKEVSTFAWSSVTSAIKKAATKTYSSLLRRYLNQIAQETAVYVANGSKGQKPSFYQWTWKSFSQDLADKAAGAYLENFFQAVQEGDQQSSTRTKSVTCGINTIKIKYYSSTSSSSNNNDLTISYAANSESTFVEDIGSLSIASQLDDNCYDKISAALDELGSGGGDTIENWNNGLNVDKYLGKDFNICQPSSMMVAFKIGLGIDSANTKDTEDLCSATQIFKNWDKAIQDSVKDQTAYLKNVQNYFDPRANDIGIAMSLNSKRNTYIQTEVKVAEAQRTEDQGALRNTNAGGKLLELPGNFALNLKNVKFLQSSALMSQTGDAFIDAANVFVSVLSNKLYDRAMERLMKLLADQDDDTKTANTKLFDFYSSANVGQAESEALLAPITDMAFTSGHDIDLLNNLASCPDPEKPNSMNCVVNNNFVQAINQELTIGQALNKELLNGTASFGSDELTSTNLETGDINWRSMKILRKYRILPVSWEVAAEMINTNGYNQGKAITIADMIGCYNDKDEYDTGYNVKWCKGLIDPNWPLKAPRSYCAKSGFGNQVDYMDILSEDQAATGTSPAVLSTVNLLRTSNYCADEQSCIKEGANNSCELYGYCTEDRRTWKFPSNTCDANYNTCQTYTNTAGQKTSYLANTLNFSSCNADNSGCAGYCTKYDYTNSVFTCAPNTTTDKYYLSGKVEDCSASEAGCQQLIRLKDNSGVNLLFNGDFEFSTVGATNNTDGKLDNWNFYSTMGGSITVVSSSDKVYAGNKALKLQPIGSGGLVSSDWSTPNQSSLPKNFLMRPGVSYTLSAYIYNNDSSPVKLAIGNSLSTTSWTETETTQTQTWEKVSVTINNDEYYNANSFKIYKAGSDTFYLDNIMFEIASQGNQGYKKYREAAYTYEKLIPEDLDTFCYEEVGTDRRLIANAPAECRNYARTCLPQEADCKLFTNKNTGDNIPAKINLQNYCPSSCVNFASFWQEPTNFNIGQEKSLIPDKAVTCSSANVGCNEFTNLSTDANAETKEYYSYLRQCVKPDEANANCAEFYTWENNENTGLQLSSHTLRAETNGAPKLTEASVRSCTATSLNINSSDYNPDCREVRSQAGEIFYVPYSKTITCSANCQTYRLSENNVLTNVTSTAACTLARGNWINNRAECIACKNGGTWDTSHERCLYRGLPAESSSCSASQNGCRKYSGTGSANWRLVNNFSFDNNSTENWSNAATSSDTFRNNGGSIRTSGNYSQVSLDNLGLEKGKKYRLQFFAKPASNNVRLNSISIYNANNSSVLSSLSSTVNLNAGWNFYNAAASSTINIDVPNSGVVLRFEHSADYFLDEVRLVEVNDEYYLLKDSLNVPIECNRDYNGTPSPGFMLGCQAYTDNDKNTHFLHGFTDICQESAVGCEMMINTNNYTNHYYPFTPRGSTDQISTTTADEVIYAIYDQNKLCSSADKGCQLLGKEKSYTSQSVFENTYLKFDPDRYRTDATSRIICTDSEVGCQTWVGEKNGHSYFKDPGNQLCEWRAKSDNSGFAWFKRPVKQCTKTTDTHYCSTNKDCSGISSTSKCILQAVNEPCPVNNLPNRTIGLSEIVQQPIPDSAGNNWVGLCPTTQSGCTEYIDPISRSGENLVKDFDNTQLTSVKLEPFTAYTVLARADSGNIANISWYVPSTPIWLLDDNNRLISTSTSSANPRTLVLDKTSTNDANNTGDGNYNSFTFINGLKSSLKIVANTYLRDLTVRKTIVNYQINKNLSSSECTDGKTEYASGCLLFNERGYQQGNYSNLNLNTNLTENDLSGVSPQATTTNNANRLIKVSPSRVCDKWLECTTYSTTKLDNGDTKKICTDFGLCNKLDPYNNCSNFVGVSTTTNQTYSSIISDSQLNNLTGYSRVGYQNNKYTNNLLNLAAMSEVGKNITEDFNGSFESVSGSLITDSDGSKNYNNYKAINWSTWTSAYNKVIVSPEHAIKTDPSFQDNYLAPDGNNFLRITTIDQDTGPAENYYGYIKNTQYLKVNGQTDYTLSAAFRTNSGQAGFKIWEYTCNNPTAAEPCLPSGSSHNITASTPRLTSNNKWTNYSFAFKTKPDTSYILVELDAFNKNGIAYFDNVKLTPSLNHRRNANNTANELITPSCRLYPEGNSLSCDYISPNNKSVRKKGLLGYCLEYDPANDQNCLLWYPLDKIGADPIEEGVGYNGKRPLYYCTEATSTLQLEYRHAFHADSTDNNSNMTGSCPPKYSEVSGNGKGEYHDFVACIPSSTDTKIIDEGNSWNNQFENKGTGRYRGEVTSSGDGWYVYNTDSAQYPLINYQGQGQTAECGGGCFYFISNKSFGSLERATKMCQLLTNNEGQMVEDNGWGLTDRLICATAANGNNDDDDLPGCKRLDDSPGCKRLPGWKRLRVTNEIYRDQLNLTITSRNDLVPTNIPIYCTKFVKVVDDAGNNVFWSDRVKENSAYEMPCFIPGTGISTCLFDESSIPFASIAYPAGAGNNPGGWDGVVSEQSPAKQPLLYEAAGSGIHLGKVYSSDDNSRHPRYIFAKSYGSYQWQFDPGKGDAAGHDYFADSGSYTAIGNISWDVPTSACTGARDNTNTTANYCYIAPMISNVKLNGSLVTNNQLVEFNEATLNLSLAFNSRIDSNQQPLKTIRIEWGDGSVYDYTGNFLDRPNVAAPHLFTHRYTCALDANNTCQINNLKIKITDNWGKPAEFTIRVKPRNSAMESLMSSFNTTGTELFD